MNVQGRIDALTKRHSTLDEKIHEEQKRPAADGAVLKDLKRQKLGLKEEITRLRAK